ncbi:MAG: NAD-dependent epimerase/dehydratase family protein [Proteobacteria bacterium]|nr:NAD-dependent epimerase/dehydratase family protein [Pseudomonadota bacterium]
MKKSPGAIFDAAEPRPRRGEAQDEPSKALVTGATGFVGAAVVRALLAQGWQVRALVRRGSDRRNVASLPVEQVVGDLTDAASLRGALEGCGAVFHVAADYRLWAPRPEELYRANVEGTGHLLDAARGAGVRRIVYTSSVATVGLPADGRPGTEDTPVGLGEMIGHYKRSKFLAEERARAAAAAGAPVVIVNPSTPIGPGDVKPTPTGQIVLDAARGRTPAYLDTGLNIVHVDDVAAGHLLAFHHGRVGERYILGGEDMTLRQILTLIAERVGRSPPRIRLPHGAVLPVAYASELYARLTGRPTRVTVEGVRMARKRMFFSSAKAARELGYRWRPPPEAFADALHWFEANGYLTNQRRPKAGE